MIVVHGLWSRRHALHLWVEQPPAPPADLEALRGRAPALAEALSRRSRSTLELLVPDAAPGTAASGGGAPVELVVRRVPGVLLPPDRAADVLAEVHALGPSGVAGGDVPDAVVPPDPPVRVGAELAFLAEVAAAVRGRVGAGAVAPVLVSEEGSWWGRWTLLDDPAWRAWVAAAAAAVPPALRAERHPVLPAVVGRPAVEVLDDLCAELTDHLAGRAAEAVGHRAAGARGPAASWARSLATGVPADDASGPLGAAGVPDLAARASRWRASTPEREAPVELLLRVSEPLEVGPQAVEAEPDLPAWTIEALLRSLDDPSLVLTPDQARDGIGDQPWPLEQGPWVFALTELARAGRAHPPLLELLGGQGRGVLEAFVTVDELLHLVSVGVPALLEAGIAVQLPGRWLKPAMSLKLLAQPRPPAPDGAVPREANDPARLGLPDLVDYSWQVSLGEESLTQDELEALVAAKSPLVRLRGEWVQVDPDRLARSLRHLRRAGSGSTSVGGLLALAAAAAALDALDAPGTPAAAAGGASGGPAGGAVVEASGWLRELLAGDLAAAAPPVPAPRGLDAVLRPYQERGVAWMAAMARHGLGVVLADDMGLGKTVQLLTLLLHERERAEDAGEPRPAPTLLVCPMSVVGNWQREAARFAPGLVVRVHHGADRARGEGLADELAGADLVLSTYATVTRDAPDLAALAWGRVALDEAQHVKNPATRAARAVRAIAAGAAAPPGASPRGLTHRVALTGTPVENRLSELHAVLDFANPGALGSAAVFRERFSVPVERHGDARAVERLATLTRPFVLRRLKTDRAVIADLPDKIEMVLRANLTAEQASLYQAVLDDVLRKITEAEGTQRHGAVLSALTRLKQVCNHPAQLLGDGSPLLRRGRHRSGKLELVDDVLDAVVADGERALCFTQYREFGAMLAPHLTQRYGTDVPFLHGGVPKAARDRMVERFGADDGPPVMLLSLRAGGTGLNLVAANHVVHLDRWWNPAVEDQATDRAFRIGQTKGVQVRKLVCVGTLEERIDTLITTKKALAESVVGAGEGWLTQLGDDDLRELFALGADAVGE